MMAFPFSSCIHSLSPIAWSARNPTLKVMWWRWNRQLVTVPSSPLGLFLLHPVAQPHWLVRPVTDAQGDVVEVEAHNGNSIIIAVGTFPVFIAHLDASSSIVPHIQCRSSSLRRRSHRCTVNGDGWRAARNERNQKEAYK